MREIAREIKKRQGNLSEPASFAGNPNKISPELVQDPVMKLCRSGGVLVLLLTMALVSAGFSAGAAPATRYAGLVFSGSTNTGAQSGMFLLSVSSNRDFIGRMWIGRRKAGFSSRFDTNGAAGVVVTITVDNSCYGCDPPVIDIETQMLWFVNFQLSPAGDSISGGLHFLHGGFPDGTLSGKRSSFNRTNAVPSAGKFTFVLAGSGDPANTNFPTGNGFGTITIAPSGDVELVGSLADGSAFSRSTVLCDDGTFPMFASLYGRNGMLQGWVGLTNSPDADLAGDVIWAKPDFARRSFYPAGFTNDVTVVGSHYTQTNPVLDWTNGVVIFQGGKLSSPFTNAVLLNAQNKVANASNGLALKIQPNSGLFNSSVKDPSTGERISFKGVVLQNESGGFGYFLDAPLSGQVLLGPAP